MTLVQMFWIQYFSKGFDNIQSCMKIFGSGISKFKYSVLFSSTSQEWKSLHEQSNWEVLENKSVAYGHFFFVDGSAEPVTFMSPWLRAL